MMDRFEYRLPDLGEGTTEAEIVAWHVAVGDRIQEDQPLLDVMTDKAAVEITSAVSGTVLSLTAAPGDTAAVGAVLAILEIEETPAASLPDKGAQSDVPPPTIQPPPRDAERAGSSLASPSVRRRADELSVDLRSVTGSGPGGRISHADLEAFAADVARLARTGVQTVQVTGLRRRIAERMTLAKQRIAHFSYVEEIDVTELEALRLQLNDAVAGGPKLTLLPFLVRALTLTLPSYPQVNAIFDDEAGQVHRHAGVHVGIATQTAAGLVVPVLRHAEALDLWRISQSITQLADTARAGNATRESLNGSTITITSLGRLGGVATTPIINHPEVAILGPNRIVERPVVRDGAVVVRKMMNLSSSFDHRVVDGYEAAEFIQAIKARLQAPEFLT